MRQENEETEKASKMTRFSGRTRGSSTPSSSSSGRRPPWKAQKLPPACNGWHTKDPRSVRRPEDVVIRHWVPLTVIPAHRMRDDDKGGTPDPEEPLEPTPPVEITTRARRSRLPGSAGEPSGLVPSTGGAGGSAGMIRNLFGGVARSIAVDEASTSDRKGWHRPGETRCSARLHSNPGSDHRLPSPE